MAPATIPLVNPDAENAAFVKLLGFRRYFVPKGTKKAIHLGHVRTPSRTANFTDKDIDTAIYGAIQTVKSIVSKVAQTGTFESASSGNPEIRALHAGGVLIPATPANANQPQQPAAAAFVADHAYNVGDLVVPANDNGHVYKVTVAGTSGDTEPVWTTDNAGQVVSGEVTLTENGPTIAPSAVIPYTLILENHAYAYGMMIEVNLDAEDPNLPCEINVAPNVALRGDGYGGGFDGQNETTLKFSEKILSVPGNFNLPASVGDLGNNLVRGVILMPNVPSNNWEQVVADLVKAAP